MSMSTTTPKSEAILRYSKAPTHRGAIFQMEAEERNLVFLEAKDKSLKLYALLDPETDRILEIKFFTYGGPVFTAIAEVVCQLLQSMPLLDACALSVAEVEEKLRDDASQPVLELSSNELSTIRPILDKFEADYPTRKNFALAAIEAKKHRGEEHRNAFEVRTELDAEWQAMSKEEKIKKIDEVLTAHVRQGLNMDGGDIEVLDIENEINVIAEYQGACGSCGSATGGTLFFIEDTLRKHVHPQLKVEPRGLNL